MKKIILLSCLLPLVLTACADQEKKKNPRFCPQVAILRSVEQIEDYGNDPRDPANLVAVGAMKKIEGRCAYEDKGVDVTFDLIMEARKGPRLGGDKVSFPFFITLVSPEEKVSGKELMTADFSFSDKGPAVATTQSLHVFIPLSADEDAGNYRVLAGFQLTEDQIKAVRSKQEGEK